MASDYGKYKLIRRIAVGGMAEVFLGVVTGEGGFKKYVAIKRILPHLTEEKDFISMFFDEARLMARFSHPHIVQIYDLGRVKNTYFLAMEFVSGLTMFRVINRCAKMKKRIPLEITARVVADVCDALDYAHNFTAPDGSPLEIVHRDVSAQNIMISTDGVVKVLDFGVAKAVGNLSRTRPSWLKGKALYMAPEQIEMKPIDRRSDIFSLGTLLYIMCTMHRPFGGESEYQVMMSIVNQPAPDPRDYNPQLPERMVNIIARALQKDPGARYQTAREMQQDLEHFLEEKKSRVDNRTLAAFVAALLPQPASKSGPVKRVPTQRLPSPLSSTPAIAPPSSSPEDSEPVLLVPKSKTLAEPILLKNKKTPAPSPLPTGPVVGAPVPVPGPSVSPPAPLPPTAPSMPSPPGEAALPPPAVPFADLAQERSSSLRWWLAAAVTLGLAAAALVYAWLSGHPTEELAGLPAAPAEPPPVVSGPVPSPVPAPKPAPPEPPETRWGTKLSLNTPVDDSAEMAKKKKTRPGPRRRLPVAGEEEVFSGQPEIEPEPETLSAEPKATAPAVVASTSTEAEARPPEVKPAKTADEKPPSPPPSRPPEQEARKETSSPKVEEPLVAEKPTPAAAVKSREPVFQSSARVLARRIEGGEPEYPRIARQAKLEATLVVRIDISPEGQVAGLRFIKTHEAFEGAVRESVQKWRFSPFVLGGEPVPTYTVYKFVFKLD